MPTPARPRHLPFAEHQISIAVYSSPCSVFSLYHSFQETFVPPFSLILPFQFDSTKYHIIVGVAAHLLTIALAEEMEKFEKHGLPTMPVTMDNSSNATNVGLTQPLQTTVPKSPGTFKPPMATTKRTANQLSPTPFPDKQVDRLTPRRGRLGTPRERAGGVFRRRISFGSSSGEDSPRRPRGPKASRTLTSEVKPRYVKCLVQPRTVRSLLSADGNCARDETSLCDEKSSDMSVKQVLREVSKDFTDIGRPPSPRPKDQLQNCVEHSKQMLVWDEWVTGNSTDYDIASISYRRVESQNILAAMPKALKPPTAEDLEGNETE